MQTRTYIETFDQSPGGWYGWISNTKGPARLKRKDGAVISPSPWWVDYNHAPPGAGYLHLLFALQTSADVELDRTLQEIAGPNRLIQEGFPTDFTNARVTLRLRGDIDLQGAKMLFHAQAKVGNVYVNQTLVGQPFQVTREWSDQTIQLTPDPVQWTCLGSRHDRTDSYGWGDIGDVLRNLNRNIILVLYPLNIAPSRPDVANLHQLRAGEDYELDLSRLPAGHVMLDEVRIDFCAGLHDR